MAVVVNGIQSEPTDVLSRVPQGYVIGPLLFLSTSDDPVVEMTSPVKTELLQSALVSIRERGYSNS